MFLANRVSRGALVLELHYREGNGQLVTSTQSRTLPQADFISVHSHATLSSWRAFVALLIFVHSLTSHSGNDGSVQLREALTSWRAFFALLILTRLTTPYDP